MRMKADFFASETLTMHFMNKEKLLPPHSGASYQPLAPIKGNNNRVAMERPGITRPLQS